MLFCVGATKAGTSWLYRYLADHPDCHLRTVKELHFFDAIEKGRVRQEIEGLKRAIAAMEARVLAEPGQNLDYRAAHIADRRDLIKTLRSKDTGAYLDYLSDGARQNAVLADITPAYALLPVERLRDMAALSDKARFLYILRDPVDRLWSHVRMMAKRRAPDGRAQAADAATILKQTLQGQERAIEIRGDYVGALDRLDAALPADRWKVVFYEDLFTGNALAEICDFLGIAAHPGDLGKRAHMGQPLAMAEAQRAAARSWLRPQYDGVAQRFGRLPDAWDAE